MIEIEQGEQIIKVVHRHWFVLLGDLCILLVAVTLPMIFLFILHLLPIDRLLAFGGSAFNAGSFFLFTWLLIVWMFGWNLWTSYYLDVLVITDKRIFNITQNGFFHRVSGSFRIDRIQNVTVDQEGIFQTLLDFGTIELETAGENDKFTAKYITHPIAIKKMINEMQDGTLDSSTEVHLHPDTLERIAPSGGAGVPTPGGNKLTNIEGL